MFHAKFFAVALAGVLVLLGTGCIVSVEPERAANPVGTSHTVTLTLREMEPDTVCGILEDVLDEVEDFIEDHGEQVPPIAVPIMCVLDTGVAIEPELQIELFEVIAGPNQGASSVLHGMCEPSCSTFNEETSWTYQSNGVPGTDVILACVNYSSLVIDEIGERVGTSQLTEEELLDQLEEIVVDEINDALGTDYDSFESLFCREVTKTWVVRERTPNIGGGLAGLFQGQPTPLPTAAAPAAPGPVIRPPNTGDAGLK